MRPEAAATRRPRTDDGIRLAFGEVRHRRLRPVEHAFRYRSLLLRLPMHRLDTLVPATRWLGIDRPAPLSFRRTDHGDGIDPVRWVRMLLAEAGVVADGELWLHTYPRVLGYTFKPVSFWFCHHADGRLTAIVAEVNNTFGERHAYLLAGPDRGEIRAGQELVATKVMSVSPFCSTVGHYRFRFHDNGQRCIARIDYDDTGGPLLVTSVSGVFEPADARHCLRALVAYPWFSLRVITAIHWQALRLWLKSVPWMRNVDTPPETVSR